MHTSFHDPEVYALYEPRNYATWLAELRALFPVADEFLLAEAIFPFADCFHAELTPQQAYEAFDDFVNSEAQ